MVLIHTHFFIQNIYGLAMTAGGYTKSLELDQGISGVL